jgi:hypothetical protein
MAKTISASVGRMGGINRPDDVRTIQNLLNKAPVSSGGPAPKLDPDGACGKKTIDAIQKFQLHHFGWPGADGKVNPNGETLRKLNEFDGPSANPGQPQPGKAQPPTPPPAPEPISSLFAIRAQVEAADPRINQVDMTGHAPVVYEVLDKVNQRQAFYHYEQGPGVVDLMTPLRGGKFRTFSTKRPLPLSGLGCKASYITEIPDDPTEMRSQMDLELPGGSVSVAMRVHLMPTTLKKARTVAVFRMPFTLIKIVS